MNLIGEANSYMLFTGFLPEMYVFLCTDSHSLALYPGLFSLGKVGAWWLTELQSFYIFFKGVKLEEM